MRRFLKHNSWAIIFFMSAIASYNLLGGQEGTEGGFLSDLKKNSVPFTLIDIQK